MQNFYYIYIYVIRFLKINFSDWITAAMLPVENFKNAKKEKVWQDTKQKYGY